MAELRSQTCSNCAAFHRQNVAKIGGPADCRLNPPDVLIPSPNGLMTVFPITMPSYWCCQWKPKLQGMN